MTNKIDREHMIAMYEIFLGKMDAYHANPTGAGSDAAMAAYYDWTVSMGVDEWPAFAESELKTINEMRGLTLDQKQRGVLRLIEDIRAAKKRAGKFQSDSHEAFDVWMLTANLLAAMEKRKAPDRALAKTYFDDMHFEMEQAERLPEGQQKAMMVLKSIERYYDIAVLLRIDSLPGAVKRQIDRTLKPTGETFSPKWHKKLLRAARKRAAAQTARVD